MRVVAAAVLLIVGVAAGASLTVPVVEGHPPTWLAFASNLLPTTPTATATTTTPTTAATTTPQTGPLFAGPFMVGAPACAGSGSLSIALHNAGPAPVTWTVGSPDGSGVTFALRSGTAGTPTLTGTLASDGTATLYTQDASGLPYHVVVVAPDGTIQLLAPAC